MRHYYTWYVWWCRDMDGRREYGMRGPRYESSPPRSAPRREYESMPPSRGYSKFSGLTIALQRNSFSCLCISFRFEWIPPRRGVSLTDPSTSTAYAVHENALKHDDVRYIDQALGCCDLVIKSLPALYCLGMLIPFFLQLTIWMASGKTSSIVFRLLKTSFKPVFLFHWPS